MQLRDWQIEALRRFDARDSRNFLCVATPGAGKTRFAGAAAANMIARSEVERIVIVVPSDNLREQWAQALSRYAELDLEPGWSNGDAAWPPDMDGVVVSYQQVAAAPQLFRRHCAASSTLVVLDEIHHCGSEKTWGEAIRVAFDPARSRLLLSGTPFRGDGAPIPFVQYTDGVGTADYTYGYGKALEDGICRMVYFPRRGGKMEWATHRGAFAEDLSTDVPDEIASQRLRTALFPGGAWLSAVIAEAHQELEEMRSEDDDAAGLVVTMDQDHARAVAALISSATGVDPVLVVSDDADAPARLVAFRSARSPWIVAVKMVSEGVDIPRLRVCVYATNVVQELTFRQVVGRVVRVEECDDGASATVFIPDDPRLRAMAEKIIKEREAVLIEEVERIEGDRRSADRQEGLFGFFTPISSQVKDSGVIAGGETIGAEEIERARLIGERAGVRLHPFAIAKLLREAGAVAGSEAEVSEPQVPRHRRKAALRAANDKIAKAIAMRHGIEHKTVNTLLNRSVGVGSIKNATEEQQLRRLDIGKRWLDEGKAPS